MCFLGVAVCGVCLVFWLKRGDRLRGQRKVFREKKIADQAAAAAAVFGRMSRGEM